MKIVVSGLKGGTGKTTIALQLGSYFASAEAAGGTDEDVRPENLLSVGFRDFDNQGSLYDLFQVYGNSMGGAVADGRLELEKPGKNYDVIIGDMPPYVIAGEAKQLAQYDCVLIPCKYSSIEVLALRKFLPLVEEALLINPSLKAGILFNQVKPGTGMLKEIERQVSKLVFPGSKRKVPVFVTKIHDRVDFSRSQIYGGVFNENLDNTAFLNAAAKQEIKDLAQEINNLIA